MEQVDWVSHYRDIKKRIAEAAPRPRLEVTQSDEERGRRALASLRVAASKTPYKLLTMGRALKLAAVEEAEKAVPKVTYRMILRRIAVETGLFEAQIVGQCRNYSYTAARHEFWLRCTEQLTMSVAAIGRMSNHDHTSVLHGIQKARLRRIARGYAPLLHPDKDI